MCCQTAKNPIIKSDLDVMMDVLGHSGEAVAGAVRGLLARAPLAGAQGGARGEEVGGGQGHQAPQEQEKRRSHPRYSNPSKKFYLGKLEYQKSGMEYLT